MSALASCGGLRTACGSSFCHSTVWIPGAELKSLVSAASVFTCSPTSLQEPLLLTVQGKRLYHSSRPALDAPLPSPLADAAWRQRGFRLSTGPIGPRVVQNTGEQWGTLVLSFLVAQKSSP